jgi:signal peptidase I
MTVALLIGVLLAAALGQLALYALFLWLGCRTARIPGVTYARALLIGVLTTLVSLALGGAALAFPELPAAVSIALVLASWLVPLVAVAIVGRASFGRTLLAWFIWQGLNLACTVALVVGIRGALLETFVVPTGSMAETILGYHRTVTCPECGYRFPVNGSSEADPQAGERTRMSACACPNCRHRCDLLNGGPPPPVERGDCFLATKGLLSALLPAGRGDLAVFRFPGDGSRTEGGGGAYVQRLIGLPGETVGIHGGKVYLLTGGPRPSADAGVAAEYLHLRRYMHEGEQRELLERPGRGESGREQFQIVRKRPEQVLALRRLVYDNDHRARDLKEHPRWSGAAGGPWTADEAQGFRHEDRQGSEVDWLLYRHLLRQPSEGEQAPRPQLITDFLAYSAFESVLVGAGGDPKGDLLVHRPPPENWVGDLLLECEVAVDRPAGELVLELAKGADRFAARWDLVSGDCTLVRAHDGKEENLDSRPTAVKQPGTYRLRFANVDDRLTVWVDEALPFGDGVPYEEPVERGPTAANDLRPAGIGARGAAVSVRHIRLWRDTYYTLEPGMGSSDSRLAEDDWADPERWGPLRHLSGRTYYVQPGHYFVLGDNSAESSDSRSWGTVPERLLRGRAVCRYYPFSRAGLLR